MTFKRSPSVIIAGLFKFWEETAGTQKAMLFNGYRHKVKFNKAPATGPHVTARLRNAPSPIQKNHISTEASRIAI
jgi:hypothetical protein